MTRGTEVTAFLREVRAQWNALIRQGESKQGRMSCAAGNHGGMRFAESTGKAKEIHGAVRELTPGPRGSGED